MKQDDDFQTDIKYIRGAATETVWVLAVIAVILLLILWRIW